MQKDFFFYFFIRNNNQKRKAPSCRKNENTYFRPRKIYIKIRLQLIEIERKIVQKGMWHTHGKRRKKGEYHGRTILITTATKYVNVYS